MEKNNVLQVLTQIMRPAPAQTCPSSYSDAGADEHDAGRLTV